MVCCFFCFAICQATKTDGVDHCVGRSINPLSLYLMFPPIEEMLLFGHEGTVPSFELSPQFVIFEGFIVQDFAADDKLWLHYNTSSDIRESEI